MDGSVLRSPRLVGRLLFFKSALRLYPYHLFHTPIYITELVMVAAFLRAAYDQLQGRHVFKKPFWRSAWPWIGFAAIAMISMLRGLQEYPLADVIRDAALAYYAAFVLIVDWAKTSGAAGAGCAHPDHPFLPASRG